MYVDEKILNQFSAIREVFKDQPIRRLISEVEGTLLVIQCSNKELTPKQVDAIDLIKRAKMEFIDCIERKKVLDDSNIITVQTKEYGSIEVIPVDTITDIELADVQPVVRCKDCKYAQNPNDTMVYCTYFECGTMSQDDFCSHGERNTKNENN